MTVKVCSDRGNVWEEFQGLFSNDQGAYWSAIIRAPPMLIGEVSCPWLKMIETLAITERGA